jgi:secondary thiamine-phosphate synthase enzyme
MVVLTFYLRYFSFQGLLNMPVTIDRIIERTTSETDIIDITSRVVSNLENSEVVNGTVNLFVPGSTAALTTIEFESGVINDLKKAIEKLATQDDYYEHNERWGDGNGYSHVRAALVGPSLSIPVINGILSLGTWQQIVLLDFDNRPRKRNIVQQIIGV